MRDRGSMAVLVVLVAVGITASITLAMTPVLVELTERQQARSAADAAALAGAADGRDAAVSSAARNGGTLVGWSTSGHRVTVVVRFGSQQAAASATDGP